MTVTSTACGLHTRRWPWRGCQRLGFGVDADAFGQPRRDIEQVFVELIEHALDGLAVQFGVGLLDVGDEHRESRLKVTAKFAGRVPPVTAANETRHTSILFGVDDLRIRV